MRLREISEIGRHRYAVSLSDGERTAAVYEFEVQETSGIRVAVAPDEFTRQFVPSKAPAAVYEAVLALDAACSVELPER
jgi:hypothetical protein